MARTDFIPAIHGFRGSYAALREGYRTRALKKILSEALSKVLSELKRDYYGGVEAYDLAHHLARWSRSARLEICGGESGKIFTILDYFNANLFSPQNFQRLTRPQRDAFQRFFWQRSLENMQANFPTLIKALAVTALLPDEWYPQAVLDRQIKGELRRLRIYQDITIHADLGLAPGGLDWMARTTSQTLTPLQEHLKAGKPWPVRMIKDPHRLCANRQVIAYDFKEEPGPVLRLEIYEPDCVCVEHAILINLAGERPSVKEICPPGPPVPLAGLICETYQEALPPLECLTPIQRNEGLRQLYWWLFRRIQQIKTSFQ